MLMRILFFIVIPSLFSTIVNATEGKDVSNFVNIERDPQGTLTRVTLKKNNSIMASSELLNKFLKDIEEAQSKIGLLEKDLDVEDWPEEHKKKAEEILAILKQNDLKPILEHPEVKKALNLVFQGANDESFNFRVLAEPNDPKYFDNHERILKILRQASELVKLAIGNSYGATIALFFVQVSFDMILERRNYFQNYLLFHIEKYGPSKFGLTEVEAKRIKSSIFESRIRWWEFWERNEADADWEKYGYNKHLDTLVMAKKRRKAETLELPTWGNQLGFAFHDGEIGDSKRIVNLVTQRSILSSKLSHAFDFSVPKKILTTRLLYFLLQIGVRMAPVPAASTVFDFFVDSLYIPQRQMEGALFGYFRDEDSIAQAKKIAFQSINPFVVAEILSK